MIYVALLRGINVGGKNKVPMLQLKKCLIDAGLDDVQTYIQSGNVIFSSSKNQEKVTEIVEKAIEKEFNFKVPAIVLTKQALMDVALHTPADWLERDDWKYNYIFLRQPYDINEVLEGVGELKPKIEFISPGNGVLYQSMSIKLFGRTTTGKLASKPVYKQMTIRNHNTVTKLLEKMKDID